MPESKFRPIPNYTPEQRARIASLFSEGPPESCWKWKGAHTPDGYGLYNELLAHRVVYALHFGKDISSICILHSCDHPPCINPWHMFEGSLLDNNRDRHTKGRSVMPTNRARGSQHGKAKLTNEQVAEIKKLYASGLKARELAMRFGVCKQSIYSIIHGHYWLHVK